MFYSIKDIDRKLDANLDSRTVIHQEPPLSIKLKIKEPGRLAFSLISFKYQPSIDHPVSVAQELVAENHVYGHDYILVAANIDKILSHKGKIRFTLHKVDGKGLINKFKIYPFPSSFQLI
jgi:hypothetical protein